MAEKLGKSYSYDDLSTLINVKVDHAKPASAQ